MPQQPSKSRKRAPGAGRPSLLAEPVRVVTYLEAAEVAELDLLGGRAEIGRQALRDYLAREDIRARIEERRALLGEGQD